MMRTHLSLLAGLLLFVVPGTPGGAADEDCSELASYEAGSDLREILFERPEVPVLDDCALDVPGVVWNGCLHDDEHRALPCGTTALDDFSITIADDFFDQDVGGYVCTDADDDLVCGEAEEGELGTGFCGSITLLGLVDSSSIYHLVVFVDGPVNQPLDCDGTANPVGGTRGFVSLSATVN